MTWHSAFEGLPWTAPGCGARPADAADVLREREKRGKSTVQVPWGVLVGMASRLDSASRALVAAEGGVGAALGPADLAAYTAAQEAAAERAAVKTGVLYTDSEEDSCWSALYDHAGRLVEQGHGSNMRSYVIREGWSVVVQDAPGILDVDSGAGFPATKGEIAALARKRGVNV